MVFDFTPRGVCAQKMRISVENGVIEQVQIMGGCHGNSQGICALVKGMAVEEVIARLEGIRCGFKATSCPAQLAEALRKYQYEIQNG